MQIFHNLNSDSETNWIGFKLEGVQSNRSAVGARIEVQDMEDILYIREVTAGSGFASQNSFIQHMGMSKSGPVQSIIVHWPSGLTQSFGELETGHYYIIKEGEQPSAIGTTTTSIAEIENFKNEKLLLYPNPGSQNFEVKFELSNSSAVNIKIFDLHGKETFSEYRNNLTAGKHYFEWNATKAPNLFLRSGIYVVVISTKDSIQTGKISIIY